jgi:CBS domain-containing protein
MKKAKKEDSAQAITVSSLMTRHPVTVAADTSLIEAATILSAKHFNGLPVVKKDGTLIGIMTDNDLLTKGSTIHLPTFLKLIEGFKIYQNDDFALKGEVRKILKMKVKDVMNSEPLVLEETATMQEGLRAFAEHHRVNPIPIVDGHGKLKGVLSRHDIIKMFGAPSVSLGDGDPDRSIDRNVNVFLSDFEKQFLLVSKTRTRYWLLFSFFFAAVGFLVAFALILQFGPGR